MLATQFGESTLNEKGSGEFDPSFVITKLGSKVNRVIVAGLLERLEPRDTANGSVLYQGQIRDPSGVHYLSVGDYASDSMRELTLQLSPRVESGEPILLLMVAKTRLFQTEEGAIYTSLRPEEACEIDSNRYATWLTRTCQDTLQRMKTFTDSLDFEPTIESLTKENVASHMIEGLVASRNHYGEIDLEHYNLNIMQALDIAEGKIEAASTPPQQQLVSSQEDGSDNSDELGEILLDIIKKLDQGEGVDFETLITNASARGFSRSVAEEKIESLSDEGSIHEPAFGWFRIVS
jgi:hypothetical protein